MQAMKRQRVGQQAVSVCGLFLLPPHVLQRVLLCVVDDPVAVGGVMFSSRRLMGALHKCRCLWAELWSRHAACIERAPSGLVTTFARSASIETLRSMKMGRGMWTRIEESMLGTQTTLALDRHSVTDAILASKDVVWWFGNTEYSYLNLITAKKDEFDLVNYVSANRIIRVHPYGIAILGYEGICFYPSTDNQVCYNVRSGGIVKAHFSDHRFVHAAWLENIETMVRANEQAVWLYKAPEFGVSSSELRIFEGGSDLAFSRISVVGAMRGRLVVLCVDRYKVGYVFEVWSPSTGRMCARSGDHGCLIESVCSIDGDTVATLDEASVVRIWSIRAGCTPVASVHVKGGNLCCMCAPTPFMLLVGDRDGMVTMRCGGDAWGEGRVEADRPYTEERVSSMSCVQGRLLVNARGWVVWG